jgi:hypothetical protein
LPFITPGAKLLDTVRLDIAASAQHRDLMLGELNAIGSEDEATKWAHRRLAEKNKLNAADANLPCKNRGPSKRLRRTWHLNRHRTSNGPLSARAIVVSRG